MNYIVKVILIFIMTFSGSMGAFFLKRGAGKITNITVVSLMLTPDLYFGGFLYVLGSMANIYLLRIMPYTIVYPITSLTYVWTLAISVVFLKEKVRWNKVVAVFLIILGIVILTG